MSFYANVSPNGERRTYRTSGLASLFASRGFIIFVQIAGTLISVISLLAYISYFETIVKNLSADNFSGRGWASFLLAFVAYFAWKTIYSAFIIIRFMRNNSDADISDNRFVIAALSFNAGGFFTPFVMTGFPNTSVQSSINSRWFLSRVFGILTLVGGPLLIIIYFAAVSKGANGLAISEVFNKDLGIFGASVFALALGLTMTIFGGLTVGLYFNKQSSDVFNGSQSALRTIMRLVAMVWLIITTIELFCLMFLAVIRLLGMLADFANAFGNNNGFMLILFILPRLMLTLMSTGFYLYTLAKTMSGLWVEKGGVSYKRYESLERVGEQMESRRQNR